MTKPGGFSVRRASWLADQPALRALRSRVFIDEQKVPPALEWDDAIDAGCLHVLAQDADGQAIGCGRLLPDGVIGRMAVLPQARGRGVGAALLQALLQVARERGHRVVTLSAQVHALGFYARAGFVASGDEYVDAGIPHRAMSLVLPD